MEEHNWQKSGGGGVCSKKKKEVYTQDRRWETGWPVDQDGLLFSGQLLLDHSAKEALGRECPLDSTLTH